MRSSTTFLIFFGLVVVVVIIGAINSASVTSDPVVKAALAFQQGIQDNNTDALQRATDMHNTKFIQTGTRLVSIKFNAIAPFEGSFVKRPEVQWMYSDLTGIKYDSSVQPVVVKKNGEQMATLACGPFKLYLREVQGQWLVFYVDKPTEKSE